MNRFQPKNFVHHYMMYVVLHRTYSITTTTLIDLDIFKTSRLGGNSYLQSTKVPRENASAWPSVATIHTFVEMRSTQAIQSGAEEILCT